MADRSSGIWMYRGLFVGFAALIAFLQLLPLNPGPGPLPGPDILLVLALSWTIRRPDVVPVFLIAAVFLVSDFLLMRPLGLWTALAIVSCEFMRTRRVLLRNSPFLVEWLAIAGVVTAMTVANTVVLSVFAVPQPSFGLTVIRLIFTILAYPLVVLLMSRALGLAKPGGDREVSGGRL